MVDPHCTPDAAPVPMKTCTKCGATTPATEFYRKKRLSEWLQVDSWCKECVRAQRREDRRTRGEDINAHRRRRYAANPEHIRIQARQWRAEHREHISVQRRRRYAADPETARKRTLRWMANNPDKVAANEARKKSRQAENPEPYTRRKAVRAHRRLSREHQVPMLLTAPDIETCLQYFRHRCAICGRPPTSGVTVALDHWIPLVSPECPGTLVTNIVPLCHGVGGCNNKKHARDPFVWLYTIFPPLEAAMILHRIETYFRLIRCRESHQAQGL